MFLKEETPEALESLKKFWKGALAVVSADPVLERKLDALEVAYEQGLCTLEEKDRMRMKEVRKYFAKKKGVKYEESYIH